MLLKNDNSLKSLSKNLFKSDRRRNNFILMSIILTTILLTTVSYMGLVIYDGFKELEKVTGVYTSESVNIIVGIIFILILVIGSGYLIIYNIFYISIINDIRFYGQLKTLGCTKKQLGKLIYSIGAKGAIRGIPVGIILGIFIGRIIAKVSLREVIIWEYVNLNNYLIPTILGVTFTVVTLFISIRKPIKILGKISAVEAIKHNGIDNSIYKKSKKKTEKGPRIKNMAKENMLKNKKKILLSVLSIALSSTLLSAGIIIGIGLDVEEHGRRFNIGDVNIDTSHNDGEKILEEDIEKIRAIEGVKNIDVTYSGYENIGGFLDLKTNIKIDEKSFEKEFSKYERGYNFSNNSTDITMNISAMNKEMAKRNMERMKILDGKLDFEKFETGDYAILNRENREIKDGLKVGDKITVSKNNIFLDLEIMAIAYSEDDNYMDTTLGVLTVSNENLLKITNTKITPSRIVIDTEKNARNLVLEETRNVLREKASVKGIDEFITGVTNLKNGILLGVFLGTVVFLVIAILNMLNIVITDLIERKREFSTLEAIGMERKMLVKLLEYEGMYYLILSLILVVPLSLIAAVIIPKMMPIYGGFSIEAVILAIGIIIMLIYLIMIVFKKSMLDNILNKESLTKRLEEF